MHDGNAFAKLWALGYQRLVPITPPQCTLSERSSLFRRIEHGDDARGKAPGMRWSDGSWSGMDWIRLQAAELDLARWHSWGAGVGIRTGDGLALIDADTLHEDRAKIILEAVQKHFGTLPVRIGRYPKAGYLIRVRGDFKYTRIDFRDESDAKAERVEILYDGRQFVANGIHPATGKPYTWPHGLPAYADVPEVDADALTAFLEALKPLLPNATDPKSEGGADAPDQATLQGDPGLIEKAVRLTPNNSADFPGRNEYIAYGYAVKGALQHDPALAYELWADWCARWSDPAYPDGNDPGLIAEDWGRMQPPFRVGASLVYETAERLAPAQFDRAEQWFDARGPTVAVSTGDDLFPAPEAQRTFKLTAFDEAAATALATAAAPLIKGILDQGAMTVLYGESNAGKTFVAMDIGFHIATGRPWAGKRTVAMPVLYVAAEGGQGARKRAAALAARYGGTGRFYFLLHPINLLRADADLKPLLATVAGMDRFGLIVIDTLSRAMAGGDENASTDMGAMVKHLDVLRHASGAHLMVVHHSGKDRAKGARGHSLLRAATDTEIEVADREIVVTKQRDLDGSFSSAFGLDVVTLGVDADGDPVTSCVVRLLDGEDVEIGVPSAKEGEVLAAVSELEAFAVEGVSIEELGIFFGDKGDKLSANSLRMMLKKLVAKNLVTKAGRNKWRVCRMKKVVQGDLDHLDRLVSDKSEVVQGDAKVVQSVFQ